jgi:hypothetical protein
MISMPPWLIIEATRLLIIEVVLVPLQEISVGKNKTFFYHGGRGEHGE